jgi:hypothetical protein
MSDSTNPQRAGIEVSPEEMRFLRGFVRRQLVPWTLMLLAVWALGGWWTGDSDVSDMEARTAAALAQVRSENQKLRADLTSLRTEMLAVPASHSGGDELERRIEDAKANVRMIESRISAALDRRISALEAGRTRGAPMAGNAEAGPPPDAAAWDVSAILDRLYALEMREGQGASGSADRGVADLERRMIQLEAAAQGLPVPAGPAPSY